MSVDRRSVLRGAAAGAAGVGFATVGTVPSLAEATPGPKHSPVPAHRPFPPLLDDPAGVLALPPGFRYKIVTKAGETKLKTGQPTPSQHDGMAVFDGGRSRHLLIQNHEVGSANALGVPPVEGTTRASARPAAARSSRSTGTAPTSASGSASPGPSPTAPAATPRGAPG